MQTIVIGSLNTDLVATGVSKFPNSGELVYGKELLIGAGGKSRNIADMVAHLLPKNSVAMIGRTVKDPYGLWQVPIKALKKAGVNTDYINIQNYSDAKKLPGIALIPVDKNGNNQIFVLPGVSDDFSTGDIDNAIEIFKQVGKNKGILIVTLECPLPTAIYATKLANNNGIKVLFDPGGIKANSDINDLIKSGIYLIKPNEYEAKILTGVSVVDFKTAKIAATKLHNLGIKNIIITAGEFGAYLFTKKTKIHIPTPKITTNSDEKDETGCGDQTMAALCAFLQQGKNIQEATKLAITTGTLQFYKKGVKPITLNELNNYTYLAQDLRDAQAK